MLLAKTHKHQSTLAHYCRTGETVTIQGAIQKNLKEYRRLVFNNVMDSLSTAYPITEKLLQETTWNTLVNRFFSSHDVQSPQIWYMPKEFKDYVIQNETQLIKDFLCLADLLEFEWTEVEVFMMPDIPSETTSDNRYTLNPEIHILKVTYPVHLKNASFITEKDKGTYFVSLHRNPQSGSVQFTNLSIPFVDVLEHLSEAPLSEIQIKNILKKYATNDLVDTAFQQFIKQALTTQLIFK